MEENAGMKWLMVMVTILLAPFALFASQRVMVIEDFTATWCTYCPGAARGAEELKFRAFDSVVVIGYHSSTSDPFYTSTAAARRSYYAVSGYPTVRLDGSYSVVGGLHTGTMYPTYRGYFDTRKTQPSPLEIRLDVSYDSIARNGTLTIVVRNTSGSSVSAQLHTALIESHIYYPWQGMDSLQDVERTMLPSASGEAIAVPAGDSVVKARSFTINAAWVAKNCEFVVFCQNNSTKEIYQGALTAVMPKPTIEFVGYAPVFPVPGGTFNLTVGLRNIGTADASGATAVLSTSDPNITVTGPSASFGAIAVGEDGYTTTPFVIQVTNGCPDPHLAMMRMVVTGTNMSIDTVEFPLNIATNTGFLDNMEFGEHGWTHGGIRDYWHLSTYRSQSPVHSWYCGVDGNHQYTNENDARLMTPFFTVGESTRMTFRHYYDTEAGYDFCLLELNNGSPFWRALDMWDGNSGGWQQEQYNLGAFRGQTVQLRFRFISDYNVVGEGWYIDDFWCSPLTGIGESPAALALNVSTSRNPVRDATEFSYSLPSGARGSVVVYDATGRLVRRLASGLSASGRVRWDLRDDDRRRIGNGTYFVRLVCDRAVRTVSFTVVD